MDESAALAFVVRQDVAADRPLQRQRHFFDWQLTPSPANAAMPRTPRQQANSGPSSANKKDRPKAVCLARSLVMAIRRCEASDPVDAARRAIRPAPSRDRAVL